LLPDNRKLPERLPELALLHDDEVVPGGAHGSPICSQRLGTEWEGFHRKRLAASPELAK
jgi:hypothetical protein